MDECKTIIAANIIRLRKSLGLTQTDFAEKLNYSDKAVSKWERAESLPDILILKQICDMCSVSLDYLVTDHSHEKPLKPKNPHDRRNHIIITALSVVLLWLLATVAVVVLSKVAPEFTKRWIIFLGTGIASEIVVLVFNSIWGRAKLNYIIISVLLWSVLAAVYFVFSPGFPLIFLIGIPGQIIIVLWSLLYVKHFRHN